jgi:hypothetical protein
MGKIFKNLLKELYFVNLKPFFKTLKSCHILIVVALFKVQVKL